MSNYHRTHSCGALRSEHVNQEVSLCGWVHKRRDHGGLIFVDLRDRFGLTQLIFDPEKEALLHERATRLRHEWVICVQGKVRARKSGMTNPNMATGEIEVEVTHLEILSEAKTTPFSISDDFTEAGEELRLKYRYLDIRRGTVAQNLVKRHQAMMAVRRFLDSQDFLEISTPILAKSTPEGARDYLVPSRVHPGNFYALPQSPQIFKQLLMIAGMHRYFQIAPCFRDEDLRADRQPEFHQIDIEMSFAQPQDIMGIAEGIVKKVFKEVKGIDIPTPFPHMTHAYAKEHYGTDRPDLRFGMPLVRVTELANASSLSLFKDAIAQGAIAKAICVPKGAEMSRKDLDRLNEFVKPFGLSGLAPFKLTSEGWQSSVAKFFTPELLAELGEKMQTGEGDLILIACAEESRVNQGLDHLRRHLAKERHLIDEHDLKFLWVTEFPLFNWDEEEGRLSSEHHPFTAPHPEDLHLLEKEPLKVRSVAYDAVLNGYEIGGGSQRIHTSQVQEKIFQLLSLSSDEIKEKFGFFMEALSYGTPPHLGIALGLDRLIMILCQTENIREVIAFPKTAKAADLMLESPSPVRETQLGELAIQLLEAKERSRL